MDLAEDDLRAAPVALVLAALFFEHAGVERALDNAIALVARGGRLSVVLQLPQTDQGGVSVTPYPSIQQLAASVAFVDVAQFRGMLEQRGFRLLTEERRPLSTGKTFWFGVFASSSSHQRD